MFDRKRREALIELKENDVLSLPETIDWSEISSADTEPNIRCRIKDMFEKYCEDRSEGRFDCDLLRKIKYQTCLYQAVVPEFIPQHISCFTDLRDVITALRTPEKAPRRVG